MVQLLQEPLRRHNKENQAASSSTKALWFAVLLCSCAALSPPSADCIANYGNHPENKQAGQLGSETAIYSDVNLSNKLNEIKTFTNSNLCYVSQGGDSAATYEPIPYATTQLIQANIKNKAASGGAIAEPLDIPSWKQPPSLPPIPKEMAAQMQYNIIEQNMLNKGKTGSGLFLRFHHSHEKKTDIAKFLHSFVFRASSRERRNDPPQNHPLQPEPWSQHRRLAPQLRQRQQQHFR